MRLASILALVSLSAVAQEVRVTDGTPLVEPPPRFGIVANMGVETVFPVEGGESLQIGLRTGVGMRFGLQAAEGEGMATLPAVALMGGFVGQSSPIGFVPGAFVEARVELAVVSPLKKYLLQPAAVVYAMGGMTWRERTVVPHFGLGVGWGVLFFPDVDTRRALSGWKFNNEAAAFVALIAALVAAGRLEVRYAPATGMIPATSTAMIGFGI